MRERDEHLMLEQIIPNPLVSRAKARVASPEGAPPWLAIHVGPGPRRVLVRCAGPASGAECEPPLPSAYRIESSASSTNGSDGLWRVELTVSDNSRSARTHTLDFDGQSWVRWVALDCVEPGPGGGIAELDVHDASDGTDDTWIFFGDELVAGAFRRGLPRAGFSFAELIHERYPGYSPALIDGGAALEPLPTATARMDRILTEHPEFRFVALGMGGHPARTGLSHGAFRYHLERLLDGVLSAGRTPVLARLPGCTAAAGRDALEDNGIIDELTREKGLLPGPDLDRVFRESAGELCVRGELTPVGRAAIHRLWADAMDVLYVPQ